MMIIMLIHVCQAPFQLDFDYNHAHYTLAGLFEGLDYRVDWPKLPVIET
jgi:hypothetical protein